MAAKAEPPQRVSLKELLETGQLTYEELCGAVLSGHMKVLADGRPVRICACKGSYSGWTFDKWGKWAPDESEEKEFEENSRWRRYLKQTWERDVDLGRGAVNDLCESLGISSIEGANFYPFPMDPISIVNMGINGTIHRTMLLAFTVSTVDIDKYLNDRESVKNLQIIEGLMKELKIDPAARNATSEVKRRLELQGIEPMDDETIRARISKIREKTKT